MKTVMYNVTIVNVRIIEGVILPNINKIESTFANQNEFRDKDI